MSTPAHASQGLLSRLDSAARGRLVNVCVICLCQAFHSLTFIGLSLFLPLIREDLQISYTQAGMLSVAATLSYALGQIPAGFLADRWGPRRLFFLGLLGWSVLSLLLSWLHSYWLAVLTLFVAGAFRALLFAPGITLLSSYFSRERGAMAMSLYMIGAYTGNILVAFAGPMLADLVGWRNAFMLFATLGICAVLGFYSAGAEKSRPAGTRLFAVGEALQLMRNRVLWICSAIQLVRFSAVTGFVFWLPSLLVSDRGFTLQAVGVVVALCAVLSGIANPLGGYLSDRLKNPPMVIGVSLAGLALCCALLVWVQSTVALLLVIAAGSVLMQIYFGPLYFVPVELMGQRAAGTAVGFSNLFANVGGLVTAYALGVVKDVTGSFKWGFLGIGVLCLTGALLSIVLSGMRRRALKKMTGVTAAN